MTGTDFCVNKPHMSRSYLNHLVHASSSLPVAYISCYSYEFLTPSQLPRFTLHISKTASQPIYYQFIHTEYYRYYVISANCQSASFFYCFLPANTRLASNPISCASRTPTVHVRLTKMLLSVTV